ncbi:DUF432 domain-containing protein [bacterium]|nr:DUF432 domain-containing protein [bacterium]
MYGIYHIPLAFKENGINLTIEKKDGGIQYLRDGGEKKVEKVLLAKDCYVLVNPVEPLHTPKDLTPYLLIEFGKKLVLEPRGSSRIYLKFSAEIGIFAGRSEKNTKDFRIIDIVSTDPGKYTLYGDVRTGILCKYYKSDIYMAMPRVVPLMEGIIELHIENKSDRWTEISMAVFNAYLMKIYYNKDKMGMKASMSIIDKDIAETSFSDSPLHKGMKKAVEHYVSRGIIMTSSNFVMEWGYNAQ